MLSQKLQSKYTENKDPLFSNQGGKSTLFYGAFLFTLFPQGSEVEVFEECRVKDTEFSDFVCFSYRIYSN